MENKKADKNFKRGIIEIRRNLSDTTLVKKTRKNNREDLRNKKKGRIKEKVKANSGGGIDS